MSEAVENFTLDVPEWQLKDLRTRLENTRWPDPETVDDWSQGVPLRRVRALVDYWRTDYNWRRCEAQLNGFGQYRTELDGLGIHFIHARSRHSEALPLLITHGWPGSVMEFHKVIGPLIDPVAYGGDASDAFHVIAPSLPGYAFSDRPTRVGWNADRVAAAWATLMHRLGYRRYVAQGGDWGAIVTTHLGALAPAGLAAIHVNMLVVGPDHSSPLDEEEKALITAGEPFRQREFGYATLQATKPQTLGYGLADSPAGQAAWIYEKFHGWTDCDGDPECILSRDEILDIIMLYWLPNTAAASARSYWENAAIAVQPPRIDVPLGCSIFPKELVRPLRKWADRSCRNIIYWNTLAKGGHFAALEQPSIFVEEVRRCFRQVR